MNRRSESYFILSKALEGFVNHKYAEGLSPRSIASYEHFILDYALGLVYTNPSASVLSGEIRCSKILL